MALSKVDLANQVENQLPQGLVANNLPYRNIIINGDMSIAQRGTSASGKSTGGFFTCDRWNFSLSSLGTWTLSQDTDVPTGQGFATSFKLDCTTADASPSSTDRLQLIQGIEGQNLQYLKYGSSNAETLTASFWVKSNKTGTYTVEIRDLDNLKDVSQTYTIDTANTWEKKTVSFPANTSDTLDNDNNASFSFEFWLGAGSSYTSGTLNTTWSSRNNANRVSSSQVNLADSTSNYIYITGVQLEAGTTASDFEFLPVDVNLQRCYRYFVKYGNTGTTSAITTFGSAPNSTEVDAVIPFSVEMRATPTLSSTSIRASDAGGGNLTMSSTAIAGSSTPKLAFIFGTVSGATAYRPYIVQSLSTGYIDLSAEL